MRLELSIALLLCSSYVISVRAYEDTTLEDDDFAEFEQFDADDDTPIDGFSEEEKVVKFKQPPVKEQFEANVETEDEMLVEDDEDNEFEHFQDPEEFEGIPDAPPRSSEQPKITISKVPIMVRPRWDAYWLEHILNLIQKYMPVDFLFLLMVPIMVRPRWDAYWLEGILCALLAAYALAYAVGRAKNTAIATNFLKLHKPLLDDNFTLVGEPGADVCAGAESGRGWRREAEHCFTMWCSGRLCCEGMLLTLKLIKRQDLVHVIMGTFRPGTDTLQVRVELGKDDGDPFVLCVGQKKHATRLAKEMQDLSVFCPERRAGDKHGLPNSLCVLSECAEATAAILDARVCAALQLYHAHIQYIHISDRYTGPKQMEETAITKPPDTEKVMLVSLALSGEGGGDELRPLLLLVLHLIDKIKRLRLSKEALSKCEKRRQKVAEAWLRGAHAARQEQAAARREEKRKQEKERILAEDDPEKQRRWELKEQKRQQKRKTPKMKQLKVKAL